MPNATQTIYASMNQRFNLATNYQNFAVSNLPTGPVSFSTDSVSSSVPPKIFTAHNIAELKDMIGEPDSPNDVHLNMPTRYAGTYDKVLKTANSRKHLAHQIDGETKEQVKQATEYYLLGNSKAATPYESLINGLTFPVTIAYFATSEDLLINRQFTVSGAGVVVLNLKSITFKSGGQLLVQTECNLNCDVLNRES